MTRPIEETIVLNDEGSFSSEVVAALLGRIDELKDERTVSQAIMNVTRQKLVQLNVDIRAKLGDK